MHFTTTGEEGRESLVFVMQEIGSLEALETLENDEDPDSEEEDGSDEGEDDNEEEEEEDNKSEEGEVQEVNEGGVSPFKRTETVVNPVKVSVVYGYVCLMC